MAEDDPLKKDAEPGRATPTKEGGEPNEVAGPLSLQGLTKANAASAGVIPDASGGSGANQSSPSTGTGTAIAVTPYGQIDKTRERIAYILLGVLGSIILIEVIASSIFSGHCWEKGACDSASQSLAMITGTLGSIFTAMIGLVGSVVGFYFGSQKSS